MRAAVIAFTDRGAALGRRIAASLDAPLSLPPRLAEAGGGTAYSSLEEWTANAWKACDALVFIGACGIAVRAIAPYVKDKFTDPAVVALDEAGRFIVPLLSGHVGGANDLARRLAALTGGSAAISTATEVNGLWAVDVWARENLLTITRRDLARDVSAALLDHRPVGFFSDFPVEGSLPKGLQPTPGHIDIHVTASCRQGSALRLIPRCLALGIGCRKGASREQIQTAVEAALAQAGLDRAAVKSAASIDLKAEEPGLLAFCAAWDLPFITYSAETLLAVPGEFTPSSFVRSVTGVDNVCERAAAANGGTILLRKFTLEGVTAAIAVEPPALRF